MVNLIMREVPAHKTSLFHNSINNGLCPNNNINLMHHFQKLSQTKKLGFHQKVDKNWA